MEQPVKNLGFVGPQPRQQRERRISLPLREWVYVDMRLAISQSWYARAVREIELTVGGHSPVKADELYPR